MKSTVKGFRIAAKKSAIVIAVSMLLLFVLAWFIPLNVNMPYAVTVTDSRGEVLHAFLSKDEKWRMNVGLNEINPQLVKAIIQKEDRWFYFHYGVNPVAVVRALVNNLMYQRKTSGASTITMQVSRLLYPAPRTLYNKMIEALRAVQLECRYSKKEILELYLNLIPYGGNIEGVKAASVLYLGVEGKAPHTTELCCGDGAYRPDDGRVSGALCGVLRSWFRRELGRDAGQPRSA